jgi:hypothetical protein
MRVGMKVFCVEILTGKPRFFGLEVPKNLSKEDLPNHLSN